MIKLHLEFKRSVPCCQQQHEAFSTSPPETSYFSLPAYHLYVVTDHILHQTQKFCHLFCPGWVSAAGVGVWLWQNACVAPQTSVLYKGHTRRICKIFWGSLSISLGAAVRLRPPAMSHLHLCTFLSLPWWHDFLA